jgi:uncharacterized protein (TIGR02145 family)
MQQLLLFLLLLPVLANAQLKEFEVSEMERPDVAVVQGNRQWPNDALLLVYSSLKDLNFRSSLGGIDKVTYNPQSNRYEILFKPNKQMLFVYASNFVEQKIETFNPNPKDVFYYKVEEKQQVLVNTKPGTLKIVTEPSGADIQLNGIPVSTKTPFTGELPEATYRVKLQKARHETQDTIIAIRSGQTTVLSVPMRPNALLVNVTSTPSGAGVMFDGTSRGRTPASFELDLSDDSRRGSKPLRLTLADHETISTTVDLRPSSVPLELDYSLKKQKGGFSITSMPYGAQVFIGGQYKGISPLQGRVEVGQYEVEVKLEGYKASKQTITVKAGVAAHANFDMRDASITPCIDPGGREYQTVQIGDQVWMAENLVYEPVLGNYWSYENDSWNAEKYGYLYDWETAKKVCPEGWHLPSDSEWNKLINYLGGSEEAGNKMKSRNGWFHRGDGTDKSGFSGLPGGYRYSDRYGSASQLYLYIGNYGAWWSSSEHSSTAAGVLSLDASNGHANTKKLNKANGYSIRCILD